LCGFQALGPLQTCGIAGSMTWKLTNGPDSTRLELSYSVGGFIPGGFDKIAPPVEAMLREQLDRLKLFVETGKPSTTPIICGFAGDLCCGKDTRCATL
jgi:hypothetical protein